MRLGFAVKVLGEGGLPSHDARRWQSGPHLRTSLEYLNEILGYLDRHDIRMYRMATALAPYASHPDLPQFHRQVEECADELAATGARARGLRVRLSSHPGQYTVLNSEDEAVRRAAVAELEVQAAVLDAMGLPKEAVVVVHVGGATGGKDAGADRFMAGFEALSARAQARLVVENDDRSYGVADAVAVGRRAEVPVVFDLLHHNCNDPVGIPDREALQMALSTWPEGVRPKVHYSSPRLEIGERKRQNGRRVERVPVIPDMRLHADLIDPLAFEPFLADIVAGLELDVMLEAKGKDLALLRLREQLSGRQSALEKAPGG
ncbi:MAG TPA: UV DNA damage repair endonuclease UvsE [Thermoleophilaceae bacterium]|nr:UV DNA damage repair endonuclease UvsE [Thermoleophilaceae bacterium]